MSQWEADPDLVQRRLAMLIYLLQTEILKLGKQVNKDVQFMDGLLTPREMEAWAHQCSNLLNAPVRKATKPIESMTDEELLS